MVQISDKKIQMSKIFFKKSVCPKTNLRPSPMKPIEPLKVYTTAVFVGLWVTEGRQVWYYLKNTVGWGPNEREGGA